MPENEERRLMGQSPSLTPVERDVMEQSRRITELTMALQTLKSVVDDLVTQAKIKAVEDKYIDERFDRVEKRLDGITSLGRWILGAFGSTFIAALAAFVAGGGLNLVK